MALSITKEMREMLEKLHALEVEGTRPFIEREGKTYLRFNQITIEQARAGLLTVTYHWRDLPVVHLDMATADRMTQTLTLTGMTGEIEIRLL